MKLVEENKVLNLRRNGFVLAPELNFSDDGNRFTGYYYDPERKGDKRFETSKLVADGQAYISVHYYNPETGKTTYFDDLNGVDYDYAIAHIKDKLTDKIDAFKAKLDAGEIKPVVLSEDEFQALKNKIKQVMELTGDNQYISTKKVFDKLSIDYDQLTKEQRNKLDKEIESEVRNAREDDPEIVKTLAKKYLDAVMKEMRGTEGHFGPRSKWISGTVPKDLENALKTAYVYEQIDGEWYGIKDLTDANQEKIKNWVRNKIENLYDFE